MKKIFLCLAIIGMIMAGCKKDDNDSCGTCPAGKVCDKGVCVDECERDKWGVIIFDNYENDGYNCYVNGSFAGYVSPFGVLTLDKKAADTFYSLRAEQASGYVLYPTEYTGSVTLPRCYSYTIKLQ